MLRLPTSVRCGDLPAAQQNCHRIPVASGALRVSPGTTSPSMSPRSLHLTYFTAIPARGGSVEFRWLSATVWSWTSITSPDHLSVVLGLTQQDVA